MSHDWSRFTQQKVDVIVDPVGLPFGVDRPGEPTGEMVACSECGSLLDELSIETPCVTQPVEL